MDSVSTTGMKPNLHFHFGMSDLAAALVNHVCESYPALQDDQWAKAHVQINNKDGGGVEGVSLIINPSKPLSEVLGERSDLEWQKFKEVVLSATGFFVVPNVQTRTVMFRQSRQVAHRRAPDMQFSRQDEHLDGNETPGIWRADWIDGGMPVDVVLAAIDYCEHRFGKSFEPFVDSDAQAQS